SGVIHSMWTWMCQSRSFGLVPEHRVVGRALLVVFSWDCQERFFRKFRWKRLFQNLMTPMK
ncbi:MAG: hypothetical protein SPJ35_03395, partial [Bacteroidaceae bacterium]|nr:hypothetical protein [Bacteroidaceae bacterium]